MNVLNDYRELIGHTPIIRLHHLNFKQGIQVFGKLELLNPGGSVKDRMGKALLEDAEKKGKVKPGSIIVEATAGNAGIGIALAALGKPYKVIFAVPEKFSGEKLAIMQALGAEIVHTPNEKGMQGAFEKVDEILSDNENAVCLNQFDNIANPATHYLETGAEIYEALDGQIDYFVAGAGSGGTISGVLRFLKSRNTQIKGVLADPIGSTIGGGDPGCYAIEGIGNTFMPKTMDMSLIDEVVKVSEQAALEEVKLMARREGILAGASSGAALAAARKISKRLDSANIVVIFPDRGDRYLSKKIFA